MSAAMHADVQNTARRSAIVALIVVVVALIVGVARTQARRPKHQPGQWRQVR